MKKILLLGLAFSLFNCANYDDEFNDLNTQIQALNQRVNEISSLVSQISVLSSTTSAISASLDLVALTNQSLQGEIALLKQQLAEVLSDLTDLTNSLSDTNTDLESVSTELANLQSTVETILSSGNIYSQDLIISSASELEAAKTLGGKLAVINGNVTIDASNLDDEDSLSTVTSIIRIVTGNLIIKSTEFSVDVSSLTHVGKDYFIEGMDASDDMLVSAGNLYLDYDGGYEFANLTTSANIAVVDYETASSTSKTGVIGTTKFDFPSVTENNNIWTSDELDYNTTLEMTGGVVGMLNLSSALKVYLGSGAKPNSINAAKAKNITILYSGIYTSSLSINAPLADNISIPNITKINGNLNITGGTTTVFNSNALTTIVGSASITANSINLDALTSVVNGITTSGDDDLDLSGQITDGHHSGGSSPHNSGSSEHDSGSSEHDSGSSEHDSGSSEHDSGSSEHDSGGSHDSGNNGGSTGQSGN